jgi:Leucine-rich repeat (LRR) protein
VGASGDSGATAAISAQTANESGAQAFADPRLAACVAAALEKAQVGSLAELATLTCNAMKISDASGLGQLRALKNLSLFGNALTRADVSALTGLETLNLANNRLASIDLSSNAELKTLYLFGNRLEALDLSANPAIEKLKAEKNRILEVRFAAPAALQKVYLFDNKMEDIKIDSLPKLRFIDVRSNPMPDEVYDYLDEFDGVKASHDGNTEEWR